MTQQLPTNLLINALMQLSDWLMTEPLLAQSDPQLVNRRAMISQFPAMIQEP